MAKRKFPVEETTCIDDCECIKCGHKFDGKKATNINLDCNSVTCPKCGTEMQVYMSVEYTCTPLED